MRRLDVLLTIDVETWPRNWKQPLANFQEDHERCVWGRTPHGEYGLDWQLQVLARHGLRGVFFVEPLFAGAVGMEPLQRMVTAIGAANQEVQLHLHSEWLPWQRQPLLAEGRQGGRLHHFTQTEQRQLMDVGRSLLAECGANKIVAFRAGSFGANQDTLLAATQAGLSFDSSDNLCYRGGNCLIEETVDWQGSTTAAGVVEMPVTCFMDRPGHWRPLQVTACSLSEMRAMLEQAWQQGWQRVVLLSHSFECLNRQRSRPDPVVVNRFLGLCEFLEQEKDRFRTIGFDQLADQVWSATTLQPLQSNLLRTFNRHLQQLFRSCWVDGGLGRG
ncbi:MAG: polysaccharide deacetylase [Magnetococcales bacterium]|nr:polysaccharide deacetylase [Magnetococcales bacterium]